MLKVIRLLTIVIAVGAILGVLAVLIAPMVLGSPTASAAVTAVLGSCSFEEIREGQRTIQRFPQMRAAMLEGSRKLREDGSYQLWTTPQGEFWYPWPLSSLDAFVLAEEQFDIYRTYRIKPGAVVLDCGANIGTFTRRALSRGAAKVVAIEINPESAEAMRRTFAKEIGEGRVVVYAKGVWDQETELELRADSVVLPRNAQARRLPVTTIDQIVSELHLPSVDFIKMDIEGAEKNALRGARGTLAKFSPAMAISAEHLPDDPERIPALVNELVPGRFHMKFGFCEVDKPLHAAPNVLHFSKN